VPSHACWHKLIRENRMVSFDVARRSICLPDQALYQIQRSSILAAAIRSITTMYAVISSRLGPGA
jgi:hypothetical protein